MAALIAPEGVSNEEFDAAMNYLFDNSDMLFRDNDNEFPLVPDINDLTPLEIEEFAGTLEVDDDYMNNGPLSDFDAVAAKVFMNFDDCALSQPSHYLAHSLTSGFILPSNDEFEPQSEVKNKLIESVKGALTIAVGAIVDCETAEYIRYRNKTSVNIDKNSVALMADTFNEMVKVMENGHMLHGNRTDDANTPCYVITPISKQFLLKEFDLMFMVYNDAVRHQNDVIYRPIRERLDAMQKCRDVRIVTHPFYETVMAYLNGATFAKCRDLRSVYNNLVILQSRVYHSTIKIESNSVEIENEFNSVHMGIYRKAKDYLIKIKDQMTKTDINTLVDINKWNSIKSEMMMLSRHI